MVDATRDGARSEPTTVGDGERELGCVGWRDRDRWSRVDIAGEAERLVMLPRRAGFARDFARVELSVNLKLEWNLGFCQ